MLFFCLLRNFLICFDRTNTAKQRLNTRCDCQSTQMKYEMTTKILVTSSIHPYGHLKMIFSHSINLLALTL